MIETAKLSSQFKVRALSTNDADAVLAICKENPLFYNYCSMKPVREDIIKDMQITPPGIGLKDKYYIGFYKDETLIAVMDLIDGYPDAQTAYIGFFMLCKAMQGQGVGSGIINEVLSYLKTAGKTAVRLAINRGNPQSTHFWKKNGFTVIKEVEKEGEMFLVAQKEL